MHEREQKKKATRKYECPMLCNICYDTKQASMMIRCGECNHHCCKDCISEHVTANIQQNILHIYCPSLNCYVEFKPTALRSIAKTSAASMEKCIEKIIYYLLAKDLHFLQGSFTLEEE
ncbi:hypothetical protein L6164_021342 [Bauhinia variegata]|uniref:Uncharacterized protein n=1 Tax=Bauhinia variegata TaxID=167791 RepID=A0ACB9MY11_BAUVA|nr:hypothetical protein L6164_021342 [Bauhinia variegata]